MNRTIIRFVAISIVGLWLHGCAISDGGNAAEVRAELDAIVAGAPAHSPPLAGLQLTVIRNGDVAFEHVAGMARRGDDGKAVPMASSHRFRIASISKLIAAIGLMKLVEDGAVDLDADVSIYLPFKLRNPAWPDTQITLRQILSHTSSIRDGDQYWLEEGHDFSSFFLPDGTFYAEGSHFAGKPGREPGNWFTYSNLNFGIVAAVIERVSGKRFDVYMRETVLAPLGTGASFNVCDISAEYPERVGTLFRKRDADGFWQPDGPWVPQLDYQHVTCHYGREPTALGEEPGTVLPGYEPGSNPTFFSPQGGLRASASDLATVAQALLAGGEWNGARILRAETVAEMAKPVWLFDEDNPNGMTSEYAGDELSAGLFGGYGLSMHRVDLVDWGATTESRILVGHLGDAYGMMGQFWLDFETGDALIALITGAGGNPADGRGVTPLYRPEDEILRWWIRNFRAKESLD